MSTTRETVKHLCKSILNRLENQKAILFEATARQNLEEELLDRVGPSILTEQDLRERTLEMLGMSRDTLLDSDIGENEQYRTAKRMVRKSFGDDELRGLYYQESLKKISEKITGFLMDSDLVEDVFESDDELEKRIIETIRRFNPENLH